MAESFIDGRNSIQEEDMPGMPTMVSILEMVDTLTVLILADRTFSIEKNISEELGSLASTKFNSVLDDLAFLGSVAVGFF